jgi:hypothetical protein
MFGFLRSSEGDNPPVHFYIEDEESDKIHWNYFSNLDDYILDYIQGYFILDRGVRFP